MATEAQKSADEFRKRLRDSIKLATATPGRASDIGRSRAVNFLKGQDQELVAQAAEEVGVPFSDVMSLVEGNYTPPAAKPSSGAPNQPPRASIGRATRAAKQKQQARDREEFQTDSARAFWGEGPDDSRPVLEPTEEEQVDAALEVRRRSGRAGAAAKIEQDAVNRAEQAEAMRPFANSTFGAERGPFAQPEDRSGPGGGRAGTQYDFDQFVEESRRGRKRAEDDRRMRLAEMAEKGQTIRDKMESERIARYNDFKDGRTPVGGYGAAGKFFADIDERKSVKREAEALLSAQGRRYRALSRAARAGDLRDSELWDEYENLKRTRARIGTNIEDRMKWAESQVRSDRRSRNQNMRTIDQVGTSPTVSSAARDNAENFWRLNMSPEQEDTVSSVRRLLG